MAAVERGIAERGGFAPGMAVLEVGSGVGGPAVTIAAHSGAHVTGLDLEERRARAAREDGSGRRALSSPASRIPASRSW